VNGDILTDFPFSNLRLPDDATAHLVLVNNPAHHARGDFGLERGRVMLLSDTMLTFSGIALYRPEFFSGCSAGRFPLLPLFKRAIAAGALSGEHYAGRWSDVGTPQRLAELQPTRRS
jgi:MurNAc alpha-1-phosphate uridylyltransferase